MRPVRKATAWLVVATVLLSACALSTTLGAQGVADRIKQKVQQRVGAGAERAVDRALDKIESKVHCLAGDDECIEKAKKAGKSVAVHGSQEELDEAVKADAEAAKKAPPPAAGGGAVSAPSAKPASAEPVDARVWENFDFVPGERVLFADDFAADRVGNFPRRLQLLQGNAQVVEARGKRWVSATSLDTRFQINLPEDLPRKFTVEFDMTIPGGFPLHLGIDGPGGVEPEPDASQTRVYIGPFAAGLYGGGARVEYAPQVEGKLREDLIGTPIRVRLQADGDYLKVYLNENRIANVPNAQFGRGRRLVVAASGSSEQPVMVGGLTVAAGGMELYDALMANGRVATQGIFFDTGSDRIRPESAPTLKQIGDMLKQYADLRLLIEGHTDNVGQAASNLSLSDRRAAAVKAHLVSVFGIDAGRLQTKGFGDTKPAAPNTSVEGRQQNRRVELVKQ